MTLDQLLASLNLAVTPFQGITTFKNPQTINITSKNWKLPVTLAGNQAGSLTFGLSATASVELFNSAASLRPTSGSASPNSADADEVLGLSPDAPAAPQDADIFSPLPWAPLVPYNTDPTKPADAWVKLRLDAKASAGIALSFDGITGSTSANVEGVAALYQRFPGDQPPVAGLADLVLGILTDLQNNTRTVFNSPDTVFALRLGKGFEADLSVDVVKLVAALFGDLPALAPSIGPVQLGPTFTISGKLQTSDNIVVFFQPDDKGNYNLGLRRTTSEVHQLGLSAGVSFTLDPSFLNGALNNKILQQILGAFGSNATLSDAIVSTLKDANIPTLSAALAALPQDGKSASALKSWLASLLHIPGQAVGVDLDSAYATVHHYVSTVQDILQKKLPLALNLLFQDQYTFTKSDGSFLTAVVTPANLQLLLPFLLAGNLTSDGGALNPALYVSASFLGQDIRSTEWKSGFSLSLFGLKIGATQDRMDDKAVLTQVTIRDGRPASAQLRGLRRAWTYGDDAFFNTFQSSVRFTARQPGFQTNDFLGSFKFALDFEWQAAATEGFTAYQYTDLAHLAAVLGHYTFEEFIQRGQDFYLAARGARTVKATASLSFPLGSLDLLLPALAQLSADDAAAAFAAAMPYNPNHPEYKTTAGARLAWKSVWVYLLGQAGLGRALSALTAGTLLQQLIDIRPPSADALTPDLLAWVKDFLFDLRPLVIDPHSSTGGYATDRDFRNVLTTLGNLNSNSFAACSSWQGAWSDLLQYQQAGTVSWDHLSAGGGEHPILTALAQMAHNPCLLLVQAGLIRQALVRLSATGPAGGVPLGWSSSLRIDLGDRNLLVNQNHPLAPL